VFILFSAYLIVNSIIAQPKFSLIGAGLLAAGLPFYWYFVRRSGAKA
jgi:hypothetical protein